MPTPISQLLDAAVREHNAGRLPAAEARYREVLAQDPTNAYALHLLGLVSYQRRDPAAAVDFIRRAIASKSDEPTFHNNLGAALAATGQHDAAIDAIKQAVALRPNLPEGHYNLAGALHSMARLDEAIVEYRHAIALRPEYGQAYNSLGTALRDRGDSQAAVDAFRKAIAISPEQATPHYNLGVVLQKLNQLQDAVSEYRRAVALQPNLLEANGNLADALRVAGEHEAAIEQCKRTLELRPEAPQALTIWGTTLAEMDRFDEALATYDRALRAQPDYAEAQWCRAVLQLMLGQWREGWKGTEWRYRVRDLRTPMFKSDRPRWDGSPLDGLRIFINTEQGAGDTINFVRYAKKIADERGGRVILDCPPALARLMRTVEGVEQVAVRGELPPEYDVHFPLMSLPGMFETTVETTPAEVPYVKADPADVERWQQRLAGDNRRVRVGLVWSGSPTHANDMARSMLLSQFAPLATAAKAEFYSLQKGPASAQIAAAASVGLELVDWTADLNDFADTAALIVNLDLVICVDTSVAHLAGALGKPVWVLLPKSPDYRWLLAREDTPWYPTMRLFRQTRRGDWGGVIERVGVELGRFAER